jgi:hypothetical protein
MRIRRRDRSNRLEEETRCIELDAAEVVLSVGIVAQGEAVERASN